MKRERVVIIGSGPAGLTAALYTARAQLNPIVIAGEQMGGQVAITHEVENYPGFPEGVGGPELVENMRAQAERFGARFELDAVTEVDFSNGSPFRVKTYSEEYSADAVIITIGATARRLGIPGEEEGIGGGVSYCGTCDGFFFRGQEILVIGGGDSAIEEAIFLTKFATKVTVVHRRDELRAGTALQSRAFKNEKIEFIWDTVAEEVVLEEGKVVAAKLKNIKTGETYEKPTDGFFVFIGHDPNSDVFGGQLSTDENGYLLIDQRHRTNVDGVFAGGEISDPIWKQVGTSVGQGTAAAMSAIHWLEEHEDDLQPLDEVVAEPSAD